MRILLVGGTRFLGPPVIRLLLAAGHEVAVFHRGQSYAAEDALLADLLVASSQQTHE